MNDKQKSLIMGILIVIIAGWTYFTNYYTWPAHQSDSSEEITSETTNLKNHKNHRHDNNTEETEYTEEDTNEEPISDEYEDTVSENMNTADFQTQNQNQNKYTNVHINDQINQMFPGNYLDKVMSMGNLTRWHHKSFPLKVYIQPSAPEVYRNIIKNAFLEWQSEASKIISFTFVNNYNNADIRCYFPADFDKRIKKDSNTAGVTVPHIKNNKLQYMTIEFTNRLNNKPINETTFKIIALHEIGHSLGLSGHSENENDVMYPMNPKPTKISQGDINTLKLLYSIIPDVSNMDYEESYRDKFWTTDDIFGDTNKRIDIEIESKLKNIQNIGDEKQPSLLISIGESYYKKKDYENAIEFYKKGLEQLGETDKNKSAEIFYNIALCYVKLNKKDSALKFAQYSYELNPKNEVGDLITALKNNQVIVIKD